VDLLNSEELDPYFNMNFDVNYLINKNLSIFAKVDNLFNQDIFIYNYYRERTLFASMGFHWKF